MNKSFSNSKILSPNSHNNNNNKMNSSKEKSKSKQEFSSFSSDLKQKRN